MVRKKTNLYCRPSDASIGEHSDEKRRTYLVRYDEKDLLGNEVDPNDDQANFSTAV